jgi:prevent-host-death family protein
MRQVKSRDARRQFSQLVDEAKQGKSVIIARYGRPVASLGPIDPPHERGLPDLSEFRQSVQSEGTGLSKRLIQSRRQERY